MKLLAWDGLGTYLKAIGQRYNYLILDSGPLLDGIGATPMLASVDLLLLVYTASTSSSLGEEALDLLKKQPGRMLGTIINRM